MKNIRNYILTIPIYVDPTVVKSTEKTVQEAIDDIQQKNSEIRIILATTLVLYNSSFQAHIQGELKFQQIPADEDQLNNLQTNFEPQIRFTENQRSIRPVKSEENPRYNYTHSATQSFASRF